MPCYSTGDRAFISVFSIPVKPVEILLMCMTVRLTNYPQVYICFQDQTFGLPLKTLGWFFLFLVPVVQVLCNIHLLFFTLFLDTGVDTIFPGSEKQMLHFIIKFQHWAPLVRLKKAHFLHLIQAPIKSIGLKSASCCHDP